MLIDSPPGADFLKISLSVIITITACTAAFFLFVVGKGIAIMRRKPTTGVEGMRGERGKTLDSLDPEGSVALHGEIWSARSVDGATIPAGTKVRVRDFEQMMLVVENDERKTT